MLKVNAIGDNCPIPVIKTKKAMQEVNGKETIEVLVDNEIAVQNVTKMASSAGAKVTSEKTAEKASVPTDPLAGHTGKIIDKYYLTKGSTYKDVTTLLQTIDSQRTGLDTTTRPYYFRVDKDLTDKYFRRVRAYDDKTTEQIGEYLVAKDKSAVWRMDTPHEGLIYDEKEPHHHLPALPGPGQQRHRRPADAGQWPDGQEPE